MPSGVREQAQKRRQSDLNFVRNDTITWDVFGMRRMEFQWVSSGACGACCVVE